ncbi:putative peptide methionine sulfoxide reductase msrB [Besnoitia besnoiti]|uniref:Putative peptide methionine sulfoxide reductase msrB n=1 Tax=Besnoitia besnoiti TaxID=94643 RepID=A0A2A9MAX5_BESBE|nr:putative peptide methionine sulfoxide reductase msrB [Besnoitia besnoiti]PFH34344.1 putative peptide methionine sulfoxide reductase msrB [Besnoitia besnoiti]
MALSLPARAAQTLWFFVQLLTFPVLQYSSSAPPAAALGFFFSAPMPTCVPSFARRLSSCLRLCAPARSGGSVSRRGSFSLSHTLSQPAKTFPCFAGRSRSTASLTTRMASPESGASPPSASADAAQAAPREVDVKRDVVPFPGAKTEEQWKSLLTPEQFRVLRMKGTEAPHTGYYNRFFSEDWVLCMRRVQPPALPCEGEVWFGLRLACVRSFL